MKTIDRVVLLADTPWWMGDASFATRVEFRNGKKCIIRPEKLVDDTVYGEGGLNDLECIVRSG